MARNSEKAQSMLFRFRAAMAAEKGIYDLGRTTRPKNISSIDSIPVCERWRGQVVKELNRKMTKIHDASLSEYQIRDLNDEINKLQREKFVWELRIRELGGPNYSRGGVVRDEDGVEIPGASKGYRYYGRARELPAVKELFEQARKANQPPEEQEMDGNRLMAELSKRVNHRYYGYGIVTPEVLAYEQKLEAELKEKFEKEQRELWEKRMKEGPLTAEELELEETLEIMHNWRVPTQEEMEEELIRRAKQRLLDQLEQE